MNMVSGHNFYTLDRSTPFMAQMTRSGSIHIPHVVSLIKMHIFLIFFTQKCEQLHYATWQLLRAITRASFKIRARCLHQTGGFLQSADRMVLFKLSQTDPCCHGNQSLLFEHKIGCKSASIGDTSQILASNNENP